jgi:hypothetical protein
LAPGGYMVSFASDIPLQEVLFNEDNVLMVTVTETGAVGDHRQGVIRPLFIWRLAN